MFVEGFPAALAGTNCWVIAPGKGEQCVIVDPGYGVGPQLAEIIETNRLHPVAVLLTHGHLDHTFSVLPVCQATDVPAYIHSADRAALADPWSLLGLPVGAPLFGVSGLTFAEPDDVYELADGEPLEIAGLRIGVTHAPGHTAGSVMFGVPGATGGSGPDAGADLMFTGDVLFAGSIGRTDLAGGSFAAMQQSLLHRVLPLPDETVVHPGHGPSTTIGRERRTNPYLADLR